MVTYRPDPARVDALYHVLRDGLFEHYEVVPFEEGEMIYDAAGIRYRMPAAS